MYFTRMLPTVTPLYKNTWNHVLKPYTCRLTCRFLRQKASDKVRVLMRAEKTLRVRANHPCETKLMSQSQQILVVTIMTAFCRMS